MYHRHISFKNLENIEKGKINYQKEYNHSQYFDMILPFSFSYTLGGLVFIIVIKLKSSLK